MFIYLFEDGGLVYSKDEPTEVDLQASIDCHTTIIRTSSATPQEYSPDGVWEDIPEAKLTGPPSERYHADSYDEYEDEEENE